MSHHLTRKPVRSHLHKCCDPVYPSFWFSLAERSRALALQRDRSYDEWCRRKPQLDLRILLDSEHNNVIHYRRREHLATLGCNGAVLGKCHESIRCSSSTFERIYVHHLSSLAKTRVAEPGPRFVVRPNDLLWFLYEPFVCVRTSFTPMDRCLPLYLVSRRTIWRSTNLILYIMLCCTAKIV